MSEPTEDALDWPRLHGAVSSWRWRDTGSARLPAPARPLARPVRGACV